MLTQFSIFLLKCRYIQTYCEKSNDLFKVDENCLHLKTNNNLNKFALNKINEKTCTFIDEFIPIKIKFKYYIFLKNDVKKYLLLIPT